MSDLTRLLQALLANSRADDVPVTAALIADAREQGVVMLLHDLLEGRDQSRDASEGEQALRQVAKRETAIEFARFFSASQALCALGDAGIRVLLLKGSALAYWLYDNPAQRTRCDLDILVEDIASARLATVALERVGYHLSLDSVDASAEFETALERTLPSGLLHRIDLHWRVLNHARLANRLGFYDLWAGSMLIPAMQCDARGLGVAHALLHSLLHRVTNMPSGQHDRLIWLYDIHLLALRCDAQEWERILAACMTMRCATPALDGLQAAQLAFNTPLPDGVFETLRAGMTGEDWQLGAALDQGAMDRAHLAALPWHQKARWLRRKLFPSAAFMRVRYGGRDGMGVPRAYLHRWWVGFCRGSGW